MGFYTIFEELCKEKGVTPAQVREDIGISQSTMASWKSRGLTPRYDTARKLADYFGVTADHLLGMDELWRIPKDDTEAKLEYLRKGAKEFPPPPEARVSAFMMLMNEEGQEKVATYAEDIFPRYRRQEPPQPPPASPEGKDTTPPPDAPETAENGG